MLDLKTATIALAFGLFIPSLAEAAGIPATEAVLSRASASTVKITAYKDGKAIGYREGWVIAQQHGDPVVVTTERLFENADHITVETAGASARPGFLLSALQANDLAFVSVPGLDAPALTLNESVPIAGENIFAATTASLISGQISSVFNASLAGTTWRRIDQIAFNAFLMPDAGGAPVLNRCGQVIGLVVGQRGIVGDADHVPANEDLAVAAREIIETASSESFQVAVDRAVCPANIVAPT